MPSSRSWMISASIERDACLRSLRVTGIAPAMVFGVMFRVVKSNELSCASSPSPSHTNDEPLVFFGRSTSPSRPVSMRMPSCAITVLLRRMSANWSSSRSVVTSSPPLPGSPLDRPRMRISCGT
ncbi:hypothetical protein D3C78_1430320 [compost metagenome]